MVIEDELSAPGPIVVLCSVKSAKVPWSTSSVSWMLPGSVSKASTSTTLTALSVSTENVISTSSFTI